MNGRDLDIVLCSLSVCCRVLSGRKPFPCIEGNASTVRIKTTVFDVFGNAVNL